VSKFLGKFRKHKDYNDDYGFSNKKRNRDEHSEIKKIKNHNYDELLKIYEEEDNYYGDYTKSSRKNGRRTA
jgi:hypothetical protein